MRFSAFFLVAAAPRLGHCLAWSQHSFLTVLWIRSSRHVLVNLSRLLDNVPMDLNELVIFVRVVQVGSIRGAAEALGMPRSTVSRKLLDLEEPLRLCVGSNRDSAP